MSLIWKTDIRLLDRIIQTVNPLVGEAVYDTVVGIREDIRNNWSSPSPSAPGEPPAVVSGLLDRSIRIDKRDAQGRFASATNAVRVSIIIATDYAAALEFGYAPRNLAPRPYLRPAVYRASKALGVNIALRFVFK